MLTAVLLASLAAQPQPVVVELFTSEGCSSCPAADAALKELDQKQPVDGANILALGLHVDYWNYLGWADPFSSAQFSARQQTYSDAFGGDRVYTPQLVVDGSRELLGSSSRALGAIRDAARQPKASLALALDGDSVRVTVDALP